MQELVQLRHSHHILPLSAERKLHISALNI